MTLQYSLCTIKCTIGDGSRNAMSFHETARHCIKLPVIAEGQFFNKNLFLRPASRRGDLGRNFFFWRVGDHNYEALPQATRYTHYFRLYSHKFTQNHHRHSLAGPQHRHCPCSSSRRIGLGENACTTADWQFQMASEF
jgi:hypothetical protein